MGRYRYPARRAGERRRLVLLVVVTGGGHSGLRVARRGG
jgi:hypothetical protein